MIAVAAVGLHCPFAEQGAHPVPIDCERGTRGVEPAASGLSLRRSGPQQPLEPRRTETMNVGCWPNVLKKSSPAAGPIFKEPLVRLAFRDVGDRFGLSGFIQ